MSPLTAFAKSVAQHLMVNINIVYKLSSKEKIPWQSCDSDPKLLGGKQEYFLSAMQPTPTINDKG